MLTTTHHRGIMGRPHFHLLPIELVLNIIELVTADDLASAVPLALLSRDIHKVVVHTVYHTLFVTMRNYERLTELATGSATSPTLPLRAVQHIVVQDAIFDPINRIVGACCNAQSIALYLWHALDLLRRAPAFTVPRVSLRSKSLQSASMRLPPSPCITHLEGYHFLSTTENSMPVPDWVPVLLGVLPALTHVAVLLPGLLTDDVLSSDDIAEVADVVRAFLQQPRIRQVVLHMAGVRLADRLDVELRLTELRDPRVFVWASDWQYSTWEEEEELRTALYRDLRKGRSVWNSGEQLFRV